MRCALALGNALVEFTAPGWLFVPPVEPAVGGCELLLLLRQPPFTLDKPIVLQLTQNLEPLWPLLCTLQENKEGSNE